MFIAASITSGVGQAPVPTVETLGPGDRGPVVQTLNLRLKEAGFNPDDGDEFGRRTRYAVFAFQKHHELAVTGRFSPLMWHLLEDPIVLPTHVEADRVEVDLARQVLYVVRDHKVVLVLPVSSGSGDSYRGSNGRRQIATTPEGEFTFQRHVTGIRRAPLGILYNPYYFKGGIAVHGAPSVPNNPASHGCVRVTMWDMDLLMNHLEVGQTILVYGLDRPRHTVQIETPTLQLI